MSRNFKYVVYYFLLLHSYALKGQAPSLTPASLNPKLNDRIDDNFKRSPQEKLYMHLAQTVYTGGQTIWYKIYGMCYGKPSTLSNIVYVNLTGPNGQIISKNKLQLIKGSAHGDIAISDSLKTGRYVLQAYTAWMLNFNNSDIYTQKIFIKNLHDKVSEPTVNPPTTYHTLFFPEGGDLIEGFNNKIAFKASAIDGSPVPITANLMINGKPAALKILTGHDGMGTFKLEAYKKDTYTVVIHYPDNTVEDINLPEVKVAGPGLAITSGSEYIFVNVLYNGVPGRRVTVIAMQTNGTSTNYPLTLGKGISQVRFKKSDFSTGIVRFTLFENDLLPVAERIVFVNNDDMLNVSSVGDSLSSAPKAGNVMSFHVTNRGKDVRRLNLSASVTDADVNQNSSGDILSALLMSSEIRGYVNNPAYYFQNNSDSLQQQLDLVMLTNGWRHFKWTGILNEKPAELRYQPEHIQFAAGQIENYDIKKGLKLKLIVINPDSIKHFVNVEPDSLGRFLIDDSKLYGKANIFYDAVNKENKRQNVKLTFRGSVIDSIPIVKDTSLYAANTANIFAPGYMDTLALQQSAIDFSRNVMLKEVKIKIARQRPVDAVIKRHVKTFIPDRAFDLDMVNLRSIPTMDFLEYIKGRFPGLEVYDNGGFTVFHYRGLGTLIEGGSNDEPNILNPPYFYLDEVRVQFDDVRTVSMNDIALIRFAPPPVWFAPLGGGLTGAILVYTKNNKDDSAGSTNNPNNLNVYTISGFSVQREFAMPDYANRKLITKPDYRSTLYWNPDIKPDKNGDIKIRFYNSDRAKRYHINIQGMDADGHLASYTAVK